MRAIDNIMCILASYTNEELYSTYSKLSGGLSSAYIPEFKTKTKNITTKTNGIISSDITETKANNKPYISFECYA